MSEDSQKMKSDQRRDSIINTALKLISENGIKGTTMRAIAKEEGISETLLYRFFKNKKEVFLGIIQSRANKSYEVLEELSETIQGMIPDPRVTLPLIWKLTKSKVVENKDILTLMMKERGNIRDYIKDLRPKNPELGNAPFFMNLFNKMKDLQIGNTLTDYFTRCQEAGNLRSDIPPKIVAQIFIQFLGPRPIPAPFMLPRDDFESFEEDIEEMVKAKIEILLNGILPK
jgi:AcrR family transcriptional regulator